MRTRAKHGEGGGRHNLTAAPHHQLTGEGQEATR